MSLHAPQESGSNMLVCNVGAPSVRKRGVSCFAVTFELYSLYQTDPVQTGILSEAH
jgi:hypothetical protein